MTPTEACREAIARMSSGGMELEQMYVIEEALSAEIVEQTCGRVDASGHFDVLGAADAAFAACAEINSEPVVVAYRTQPIRSLLAADGGRVNGIAGHLEVSAETAEQVCQRAAFREAMRSQTASLEAAAAEARQLAMSTWVTLGPVAIQCLELKDTTSRSACLEKVEQYIEWVEGLEVSVPEHTAQVLTACGQRTVPLPGATRRVEVMELRAAVAVRGLLGGISAAGGRYPMVHIEAGRLQMGSPSSEKGRGDDEETHHVALSRGFWLGEVEVTQELWTSVMGSNPSQRDYKGVALVGDTLPVQMVSWLDAIRFANALSESEGLEPCYQILNEEVRWPGGLSCEGYRLPTEAEWEYAARAGGDEVYAGTSEVEVVCRYGNVNNPTAKEIFGWSGEAFPCEDGYAGTSPVKSLRPNAWGLYDMTGNVWEWVWDQYQEDYWWEGSTGPVGLQGTPSLVNRGGGWSNTSVSARVANRNRGSPDYRSRYLGVRIARSLP